MSAHGGAETRPRASGTSHSSGGGPGSGVAMVAVAWTSMAPISWLSEWVPSMSTAVAEPQVVRSPNRASIRLTPLRRAAGLNMVSDMQSLSSPFRDRGHVQGHIRSPSRAKLSPVQPPSHAADTQACSTSVPPPKVLIRSASVPGPVPVHTASSPLRHLAPMGPSSGNSHHEVDCFRNAIPKKQGDRSVSRHWSFYGPCRTDANDFPFAAEQTVNDGCSAALATGAMAQSGSANPSSRCADAMMRFNNAIMKDDERIDDPPAGLHTASLQLGAAARVLNLRKSHAITQEKTDNTEAEEPSFRLTDRMMSDIERCLTGRSFDVNEPALATHMDAQPLSRRKSSGATLSKALDESIKPHDEQVTGKRAIDLLQQAIIQNLARLSTL